MAYRTIDTPVGSLLLAATELGLVRVAYANEGHDAVLQALADQISPRILYSTARLGETARELDEYFARRRHTFDITLDWRLSKGFRNSVLHVLPGSATGTRPATPQSRNLPATRRLCERSDLRVPPTRCRSSCRVIVSCARTVVSAGISAVSKRSASCSTSRLPHDSCPHRR